MRAGSARMGPPHDRKDGRARTSDRHQCRGDRRHWPWSPRGDAAGGYGRNRGPRRPTGRQWLAQSGGGSRPIGSRTGPEKPGWGRWSFPAPPTAPPTRSSRRSADPPAAARPIRALRLDWRASIPHRDAMTADAAPRQVPSPTELRAAADRLVSALAAHSDPEYRLTVLKRLVRRLGEERYPRSEEHTSELQSLMRTSYAVFCLKKKKS